jgi:hypothetical protein
MATVGPDGVAVAGGVPTEVGVVDAYTMGVLVAVAPGTGVAARVGVLLGTVVGVLVANGVLVLAGWMGGDVGTTTLGAPCAAPAPGEPCASGLLGACGVLCGVALD